MQYDGHSSEFVEHTHCDQCGSSDGVGRFSDGHSYCFVCKAYTNSSESSPTVSETKSEPIQDKSETKQKDLLQGKVQALPARGITEEACRKYGYVCANHNGEGVQAAIYRDSNGNPVAQKLRTKDKKFTWVGEPKKAVLFGAHLYSKGRYLVIAEGELDCLTIAQVQNLKWPVVSLPNGAQAAVKAIKDNWDYVNQFENIVLMFDQDAAGKQAAQEVAEILPVGKAKIANLPCKDANECLLQGKGSDIISAIFEAKDYRPDGIVSATDYRDEITIDETASSVEYPYSMLNQILKGLRKQELVTLTAGSGVGKTTFVREMIYHLHQSGQRVGCIMLEEANKRTLLGLVGMHISKNITIDRQMATDEEVLTGFDDLFNNDKHPVYLYDHFGSTDVDLICQRIVYMAKALEVDWVVLDHLSILISQTAIGTDERKLIDYAMTKLRTLVQEHDIGMILVSHLRRPDGNRGHESGQQVRLSDLRSSHSIAQLSDACIGLQVDPDDPDGDFRHLVILKNRFTGQTGHAGTVVYNRESGRLLEQELADLTTDGHKGDESYDNESTDEQMGSQVG